MGSCRLRLPRAMVSPRRSRKWPGNSRWLPAPQKKSRRDNGTAAGRLSARVYEPAGVALCGQRYEADVGEPRAVQAFQQQLAEVAIAGFQPQFTTVSLLTDPAVSGMARDIVLSDAMMGYLHFISGIPVQGNRWLYGTKPYTMATRRCR